MRRLSASRLSRRAKQHISLVLMLFKVVILFVSLVNPAMAYKMAVVLQIIQLSMEIAEVLIVRGFFLSRRTSHE